MHQTYIPDSWSTSSQWPLKSFHRAGIHPSQREKAKRDEQEQQIIHGVFFTFNTSTQHGSCHVDPDDLSTLGASTACKVKERNCDILQIARTSIEWLHKTQRSHGSSLAYTLLVL
jgi:hypothetical protein